jgi:leucyl/phenylalanyl-tRNA---protein transferase
MNSEQYPYLLDSNDLSFPPVKLALTDPDGLLAIGGDLSSDRIVNAYTQGIFPWYSAGEPLLWWSPNPRSIIYIDDFQPSKSLKKLAKKEIYRLSYDQGFEQVIRACSSAPRQHQDGTWITEEMIQAYYHLHQLGIAHSCECWLGDELVGGLYGLAIGQVFFGESMFSTRSNSSKLAFSYLVKQLASWGYSLVDCQVESPHMNSLGAINIKREKFIQLLSNCEQSPSLEAWTSLVLYPPIDKD